MQHHKAARAVGVFGLVLQALLAQHGCVLVSQTACSNPAHGLSQTHRSGCGSTPAHRHSAREYTAHVVLSVNPLTGMPMLQMRCHQPGTCTARGLGNSKGKEARQELPLLILCILHIALGSLFNRPCLHRAAKLPVMHVLCAALLLKYGHCSSLTQAWLSLKLGASHACLLPCMHKQQPGACKA